MNNSNQNPNNPHRPASKAQPPRDTRSNVREIYRDGNRGIQKSNTFFYAVVIGSSILLAVAIFFMISGALKFANGNDTSTPNPPDSPTDTTVSAKLEETKDMGLEYLDSIIFVGDSNTAHMCSHGVLSGGKETKQVWSPVSQTLMLSSEITNEKIVYPETGEEMTIANAAGVSKPKYMIITLGTNGINYLSKDQFKYCYGKLISAIKAASPDTKLILQTIFPVTSWYEDISNETIDRANEWLLEVAEEHQVKYLDSAHILKDASGALDEAYNTYHKDGYHLNTAAYTKLLAYIRTHAYTD